MVRKRNHATGAQPFDTLAVADIGDVGVCLYDIKFVPPFFPSLQLILEKVKTGPKTIGHRPIFQRCIPCNQFEEFGVVHIFQNVSLIQCS